MSGTPQERLEQIQQALNTAWDAAMENQRDNEVVAMYGVYRRRDDDHYSHVDTFLQPMGHAHGWPGPPGDYYFKWGFQGKARVPPMVRRRLAAAVERGEEAFDFRDWRIKIMT